MNKEKLEEVERLVNSIKNCPKCFEYMLTSDERTLLIDFICSTIQERNKLQERIDKAIEILEISQIRRYLSEQEIQVLEILKGENNG